MEELLDAPFVINVGNLLFVVTAKGKFAGMALSIGDHLHIVEGENPDGKHAMSGGRRSMR